MLLEDAEDENEGKKMKLKLKRTKLLSIVVLMVLMPFIVLETNAATYFVDISQSPSYPQANDVVTVAVTAADFVREEEIIYAKLSIYFDGAVRDIIDCEETIPQRENVVTFNFGPFEIDDVISYKIYLEFQLTTDYQSEWYSFTVGEKAASLTRVQTIFIIMGSVVGFALIVVAAVVIINRRRK